MKKHQIIFDKIKIILKNHFGKDLNVFENGNEIAIGKTGIWISSDNSEITIGYENNHKHYNLEINSAPEIIEDLFNLLTNRKRVTQYFKGEFQYKNKVEIESQKGEFNELSTSATWLYPYWRSTEKRVSIKEKFIEASKIEEDFLNLKNDFSINNYKK